MLNRDIEHYEDIRASLIDERVKDLMRGSPNPKDDYSLSLPANLDEFMQECPERHRGDLLAILHNMPVTGREQSFEQIGRTFYCAFHEYMETLALSRAEREVPSAGVLRDSDIAEAAEARAQARRDNLMETYRHAA